MSDFTHSAHFLSWASPPPQSTLGLLSWLIFKTRPRREKALVIKIAHANYYSGECLLSWRWKGRWGKDGQVLEAPVGLSSTGKVEKSQRSQVRAATGRSQLGSEPSTKHSILMGGGRRCRSLTHHTTKRDWRGLGLTRATQKVNLSLLLAQ